MYYHQVASFVQLLSNSTIQISAFQMSKFEIFRFQMPKFYLFAKSNQTILSYILRGDKFPQSTRLFTYLVFTIQCQKKSMQFFISFFQVKLVFGARGAFFPYVLLAMATKR